ncbi:MAG: glycosyltransferase family 2 protein [Gemmatimonadaceae bacterium]|nr:glycosyltransferase family 2 protein [Gloeobacterales cyanobacterium ES-bin-141]
MIIPVRDEAKYLTATLEALAYQTHCSGQPFDRACYEIIVLANNCRDDSAEVVRRFASRHPTLALHVVEMTLGSNEAYVGRVRQLLMDEGYHRLASLGRGRAVIASTDGDTRVAPTWIARILDEIAHGADAVGGRILSDDTDRMGLDPLTRSYYLRDMGYQYLVAELESRLDMDPYDQWPRHYQHFGASLALTAEMYARVGGLPAVRTPEDVALYHALRRFDARFRHSLQVRVTTSVRRKGRAHLGLAVRLSEWEAMGHQRQPVLVESPAALEAWLRLRSRLRKLWHTRDGQPRQGQVALVATQLRVAPEWLSEQLSLMQPFGLLLERVGQHRLTASLGEEPRVEIAEAIRELRVRLNVLRSSS